VYSQAVFCVTREKFWWLRGIGTYVKVKVKARDMCTGHGGEVPCF
jgi:hypothetical protein